METAGSPIKVTDYIGKTVTLDEWLALPEDEDGIRTEVVNGVVINTYDVEDLPHESVSIDLRSVLSHTLGCTHWTVQLWANVTIGGKLPIILTPDIVVLKDQRPQNPHVKGTDVLLAVQVIRLDRRADDYLPELKDYASAGIPEYWIVDIDAPSLEVWRLGAGPSYKLVQTVTNRADLPLLGHTIPIDLESLPALCPSAVFQRRSHLDHRRTSNTAATLCRFR